MLSEQFDRSTNGHPEVAAVEAGEVFGVGVFGRDLWAEAAVLLADLQLGYNPSGDLATEISSDGPAGQPDSEPDDAGAPAVVPPEEAVASRFVAETEAG